MQFTASANFFGAYWVNTRARVAYCASLGTTISSFANAYEQKHVQSFDSAEAILLREFKAEGNHMDFDKLYKLMLPSFEKLVAQDMKDIALALKVSEKEDCQSMEINATAWVNELDLRKQMPHIAKVLLQK